MATKTKSKMVKQECCPTVAECAPRLYLALEGQDVSQIKDLKVGEQVEILVTGKVVGLAQRERHDPENAKNARKTGDIDLEDYKVQVLGEEENTYTKMADEMEGGE